MRIVKGSTFTYQVPLVVTGETPVDATSLPVVSVTRDDGTVLAAPTVTHVADAADLGHYTAALTVTHTSQCDLLTVTTTAIVSDATTVTTELVEVVGAHYVSLVDIRNEPGMESETDFSAALLIELRDEFEDMVEGIIGVALVRRYQRDLLDQNNSAQTVLLSKFEPVTLLSVKVDGVAQTLSQFTLFPQGKLRWNTQGFPASTSTYGARNIAAAYEHGRVAPPPQMRREALKWIRSEAKGRISLAERNMISQSYGDGTSTRFSTADPGKGRPTGIMSLDPLLMRLMMSTPGIA